MRFVVAVALAALLAACADDPDRPPPTPAERAANNAMWAQYFHDQAIASQQRADAYRRAAFARRAVFTNCYSYGNQTDCMTY